MSDPAEICTLSQRTQLSLAQQGFLLRLSDALRPLTAPVDIEGEACRLLAEWLNVDRAYYVDLDEGAGVARVARDWVRGGGPSLVGEHPIGNFGWSVAMLRQGGCHVIPDTQNSDLVPPADRPAAAALGIVACMGAPLIKKERLMGALCVTVDQPRGWTEEDVTLLREVGERIWEAVERARAEAALVRSETQYRTLFDAIDEGFCTIEMLFDARGVAVDYRFLEMNPAFVRQTGLEDAVGRTILELAPQHETFWFEIYGEVARTGRPQRFEQEAAALGRFYDVFAFRVGEPGEGRVAVVFNDVTERKRAEAVLRASEERFRRFVTASSDSIYRMSADWQELYAFEGKNLLAGTAAPGTAWMDAYIPLPDQARAWAAITRAVRTQTPFELEHHVCRSDGSVGWVASRAIPVLGPQGEITEWFGVATDITERKQAEATVWELNRTLEQRVDERTRELAVERAALQVSNEELEAFNYSVSHDLMTPVRHVGSFAQLAAQQLDKPDKVQRYLQIVGQAARRMETLIEGMLALSRTGQRELNMGVVDLGLLLQQARRDVGSQVADRKIEWHFGSLPLVQGDPGTLQQVMTNLLGNAVKYSRDRVPAVIEVWAHEEERQWRVCVRDNGAGFDPHHADRLFGIFQRLHREEEFAGTGVGLSLVRRIVIRHGGTVTAQGAVGQGATFCFTLPKLAT